MAYLLELIILLRNCLFFLALTSFVLTLGQVANSTWAWLEFRRQTKGLPILTDRSIICNHSLSWCLRRNVCNDLLNYFQTSRLKTVGLLMGTHFAAVTTDLELMRRIVLDGANENTTRARIEMGQCEWTEGSMMFAEERRWRRLRDALAPSLESAKLTSPIVRNEVDRSIAKLIEAIDKRLVQAARQASDCVTIEADELLHRYSLDLVLSAFFKQPRLIDLEAKACLWTRLVRRSFELYQSNPLIKLSVLLTPLRQRLEWLSPKLQRRHEWRRELNKFIEELRAKARLASQELERLQAAGKEVDQNDFGLPDGSRFRRNLIDHFADQQLGGQIASKEFAHTINSLVGAADTSICEVLVTALYELAQNQQLQEKLRNAIKFQGGAECEYLGWVIDEALRLLPPVPLACSRELKSAMSTPEGHHLPVGTSVLFPSYLVHRLQQYWGPDASSFKPERFAEVAKFHPMQFVPFGAGARICPGKQFALFQMRQVLAKLLLRYKFECRRKEDAYDFDAPFLAFVCRRSATFITVRPIRAESQCGRQAGAPSRPDAPVCH